MTNARLLFAATALFAAFSTGADAKLYKWTDEKGVIHYGEVIPPEFAGQDRVQFDDKGREVKPKQARDPSTLVQEDKATIDQKRHDQALLNSFSTADEIDQSRDRSLQQINARIEGIQTRLKTAEGNLNDYQQEKATRLKAKKSIEGLEDDITQASERVERLKGDLEKSQAEAGAIRARYDSDKQRFIELKGVKKQ